MQNYTSKRRPSLMVSRGGCVALPRGAMGLSAVCDCGIFLGMKDVLGSY